MFNEGNHVFHFSYKILNAPSIKITFIFKGGGWGASVFDVGGGGEGVKKISCPPPTMGKPASKKTLGFHRHF